MLGSNRPGRKWSTLLNADVVGYCAMMAQDEEATLRLLLERMSWVAQAVEAHGGRVIDAPGDNLLAEFDCENAAVLCALHVQREMERRNRVPRPSPLRLRIGVHSGVLIERQERCYGHSINLTARLQSAAVPGGVLISAETVARLSSQLPVSRCTARRLLLHNIPGAVHAFEARDL